jgi:D-lactate dehydrogenase
VVALLKLAQRDLVPVTFRAAGTSLSGQAISDSVLIVLGDNWNARVFRHSAKAMPNGWNI